jgi:hypothetical protein
MSKKKVNVPHLEPLPPPPEVQVMDFLVKFAREHYPMQIEFYAERNPDDDVIRVVLSDITAKEFMDLTMSMPALGWAFSKLMSWDEGSFAIEFARPSKPSSPSAGTATAADTTKKQLERLADELNGRQKFRPAP